MPLLTQGKKLKGFSGVRYALQAGYDAAAWFAGVFLATYLRYEMQLSEVDLGGVALTAGVAVTMQLFIGTLSGLYVHRWRYGTFEEVAATLRVVAVITFTVAVANLLPVLDHSVPVSAAIISGFLAASMMSMGRLTWRLLLERWTRSENWDRDPVIVMGAGDGGLQIVTAMVKAGPYEPVAILDDDPRSQNLRIKGVRVCGDRTALEAVAARTGAKNLVIAIPSAHGDTIRDMTQRADRLGMETLVLPPVEELFGTAVGIGDIRPVTEADLLGRRELSLDTHAVSDYITGKRVLVTGAGGSIGSELCRQLNLFAPESLVMLDRDESALQAVQLSIEGRSLLDSRELAVCCIRDQDRLREIFDEHRPEVVFHAAALKHLPLLEMHPAEGWKTNVWGTQNLLELAGEYEVEHFVNISTDKAADPSSVLGLTKRIAEQLTSRAGQTSAGVYVSVRFGNVLGSRGSVLPLFREQIAQGGPVTVTDPEVTRFFMTIPEACELVIQAGALGEQDGLVLVLDMGEPVRIAELAERLVAHADKPIEIVYTGLRPGEKLHEILFADDEVAMESGHPLIHAVAVPSLTAAQAMEQDPASWGTVVDLRSDTPARSSAV